MLRDLLLLRLPRPALFLCLASLLALGLWPAGRTAGQSPQAVVLLYFYAIGLDEAVLLEWATASEYSTAGFRLERSLSPDGPYAYLDEIGFIPGQGDGLIGAVYDATDTAVVNGVTYYYRLVEFELNGNENREGPVWATPGATPTPTPSATVAGSAPATPDGSQSGPTPTASSTPAATASVPAGQGQPTATPRPANTVPPSPTAFNQPPATTTGAGNDGGAVAPGGLAQVPPSPTAAGYPGQPAPTSPPPAEGGYPGAPPTMPATEATASPYPGGQPAQNSPPTVSVGNPVIVGGGTPVGSGAAEAQAGDAATQPGSRGFLWVAFVASLLIFVAGLVGSILLFNRQRARGE